MLNQKQTKKVYYYFLWIVLSLTVLALTAEILPEIQAKLIVIPVLILMIGLIIWNLVNEKKIERNG